MIVYRLGEALVIGALAVLVCVALALVCVVLSGRSDDRLAEVESDDEPVPYTVVDAPLDEHLALWESEMGERR